MIQVKCVELHLILTIYHICVVSSQLLTMATFGQKIRIAGNMDMGKLRSADLAVERQVYVHNTDIECLSPKKFP